MPPIEAILAPLESELKLASQEIAKLQDDNKALARLTKSKDVALLEAESTVQVALAKASMVEDLQNKNQELMKQIEIFQVFSRGEIKYWIKCIVKRLLRWKSLLKPYASLKRLFLLVVQLQTLLGTINGKFKK